MTRSTALRWSLLTSLGLLPLACSGSTDDGPSNTGGKPGTAGSGGADASLGGGGHDGNGAGRAAIGLPPSCTSPKLDAYGITTCAEGYHYRAKPVTCAFRADEGPDSSGAGGAGGAGQGGAGDSGAAVCFPACEGEHAYCLVTSATPFVVSCSQGCLTDGECGDDQLCECDGERGGVCVPASCRDDADCDDGYHCAQAESCLSSGGMFTCQRPEDECVTRADCDHVLCGVDLRSEGRRVCYDGVVCGRPFLVEATARLAPSADNPDWQKSGAVPRVAHLTIAERAQLAEHWTRMGQMEHASIAAFARFSLQLLSLGAPPELVEDCTRALADETAHTKLCFRLASSYAGRSIGPGPLSIDRSLEVTSLVDIVDLVIAEGCLGETSAALEALEAADSAADPVIRTAYTQIARDEQRHAELAFRFLRWALDRDARAVAARIAQALSAMASGSSAAHDVTAPCLRALVGALAA